MFENYQATKEDLAAIEEGIRTVWHPKLKFVFRNKDLIQNTTVLTFDAQHLYFWTPIKLQRLKTFPCHLAKYQAYKIPHKLKINEEMQFGWQANAYYFYQLLPKVLLNKPCVSGSLLTPFTGVHQKYIKDKEQKYWAKAYSSYESYLATVVHEFGHIYYNSLPFPPQTEAEYKNYLRTALMLYQGKKITKLPKIKFHRGFLWELLTAIFAFCCDYQAACFFWPNHKKDLDRFHLVTLKRSINHPSFYSSRDYHLLGATLGKIILTRYPKTWPQVLLQSENRFL